MTFGRFGTKHWVTTAKWRLKNSYTNLRRPRAAPHAMWRNAPIWRCSRSSTTWTRGRSPTEQPMLSSWKLRRLPDLQRPFEPSSPKFKSSWMRRWSLNPRINRHFCSHYFGLSTSWKSRRPFGSREAAQHARAMMALDGALFTLLGAKVGSGTSTKLTRLTRIRGSPRRCILTLQSERDPSCRENRWSTCSTSPSVRSWTSYHPQCHCSDW